MFTGIIREFKGEDVKQVRDIYKQYWTDEGFLEKLNNRLKQYTEHSPEAIKSRFEYFVAEESGEVIDVFAMRKAPEKMMKYTTTNNPVEFYVLAVKYKWKGIGSALRTKGVNESRKLGYTEIILYSPESHKESWRFHDNSEFKRVGPVSVDGEPGCVWRMAL